MQPVDPSTIDPSTIPFRFGPRNFGRFAHIIEVIVREWPTPTMIDVAPGMSVDSTTNQLRCAIQGSVKYGWKTEGLNYLKLLEIAPDIRITISNDKVVATNEVKRRFNRALKPVEVDARVGVHYSEGYDVSRLSTSVKAPHSMDPEIIRCYAKIMKHTLQKPVEFIGADIEFMRLHLGDTGCLLKQMPGAVIMF